MKIKPYLAFNGNAEEALTSTPEYLTELSEKSTAMENIRKWNVPQNTRTK